MPIQIWTTDQAPALTFAGNRDLAHGISGGVAELVKGFTEAADERKRLGQVAKSADGFVKALTDEERTSLNLPDADTFGLLGAREKIGAVTGALQAQGYKKAHQDMAVTAAHLRSFADDESNRQLEPGALANLAELGQSPEDVPSPVGNAEFLRRTAPVTPRAQLGALSRNGYRPNLERIAPLLRAMEPAAPHLPAGAVLKLEGGGRLIGTGGTPHFAPDEQSGIDQENDFVEDQLTGQRFLTRGKQVLPSGINPARNAEPAPQFDENKVLIGHVIHTGGRAGVFVRAPLPDALTANQRLTALTRQYTALMGIPTKENVKMADDVHKEMQTLMATPPAKDAAARILDVRKAAATNSIGDAFDAWMKNQK